MPRGNPMGGGNPPGSNYEGSLSKPKGGDGHFVTNSSYRTDMHVGYGGKSSQPAAKPSVTKGSISNNAALKNPIHG